MQSLWGEEFQLPNSKDKVDEILEKINNPEHMSDDDFKKFMKNKKVSLTDKLQAIKKYVRRVLGEHINTTQVIKSKEELVAYFDKVIESGYLAYDTETNNSLDAHTGHIIGLCLYSPNNLPAYVPIGHVDPFSEKRLDWQVSVEDCREQLQRVKDNNVKIIMHNGSFDYKFTYTTFGVKLHIYWDTMVGSRILNENDYCAKLKWQYKDKIDPSHPLYDIDKMFPDIPYIYVDPDTFALYSATDAIMTYKLYEYQLKIFEQEDEKGAYRLFRDVESKLPEITAEMELDGVKVDLDYAHRLENKYTRLLSESEKELNEELERLRPQIEEWKLTPDATYRPKVYANGKNAKGYPEKDEKGNFKYGKSKLEQLEDPIKLSSPTQLAILFFDILKCENLESESPRSTGKASLTYMAEEKHYSLPKKMLQYRTISKILKDFIIKLPTMVNEKTGRIHCNFNQLGDEDDAVVTGRFSCKSPNLQNIPSKNNEVRLLFCGDNVEHEINQVNDYYEITKGDEVQLQDGSWLEVKDLQINNILENNDVITNIVECDKYYKVFTKEVGDSN